MMLVCLGKGATSICNNKLTSNPLKMPGIAILHVSHVGTSMCVFTPWFIFSMVVKFGPFGPNHPFVFLVSWRSHLSTFHKVADTEILQRCSLAHEYKMSNALRSRYGSITENRNRPIKHPATSLILIEVGNSGADPYLFILNSHFDAGPRKS